MTLLEFKEAKKHYRKIAKNYNLPAKIKKGKWTHDQVLRWWIKYTHTKEFKELYKGKILIFSFIKPPKISLPIGRRFLRCEEMEKCYFDIRNNS